MKTPTLMFAAILAIPSLASAIPNPAAQFCVNCGYKSQIRTDPQGGQYGVCVFPDGSECDEWDYFRKCHLAQCGDCNCPWPCPKRIIYVDDDANGLNDGSSWQNAYQFLQDALMMAREGDELRVAQGIYKPDDFALSDRPSLGRAETFQLKNGVAILGGYASLDQPDPNARDIVEYETILSGDLDGNDIEVSDPAELLGEPTRADNCYNVVNATGCDRTAILEGLTITAGNSDGAILSGGGIFNGSPTVTRCKIIFNFALGDGGGVCGDALLKDSIISHNAAGSSGAVSNCTQVVSCIINGNCALSGSGGAFSFNPHWGAVMTDCIISNNRAAGSGGAVYSSYSSGFLFTRCAFIGNRSGGSGGAFIAEVCTCPSYITFNDCSFIANQAVGNGGALFGYGYLSVRLNNCLLAGNRTGGNGGAIYDSWDAGSFLTNCTIADNIAAGQGGGICYEGHSCGYASRGLINSIILGNSDINGKTHYQSQIYFKDTEPVQNFNYCCIQVPPNTGGIGNVFRTRPLFANHGYWDQNGTPEDPNDDFWIDGDYHLKSQAGRWNSNTASWVRDDVTSPCIDAGDPASPIGLEPFPNGGIINMGAFGGTREASKSYFGEPICETIIASDINGDCKVDLWDLAIMTSHWLEEH